MTFIHHTHSGKTLLVTLLGIGMLAATSCAGQGKNTLSPHNTCLVFDLDGVVLDRPTIAASLFKHKFALMKATISPSLWANVIRLLAHRSAGGQYQALFKKEHPELVALVDEIMQSKQPNHETVQLIKELIDEGYSLHIASNMAAQDFAFFEQKYPEIFSHFKVKKLVEYSENPAEKIVKKPNNAYFSQLLQELEHAGEKKENIIFLDDVRPNVQAAQHAGLHGILFQNSAQTRTKLQEQGILSRPSMQQALPQAVAP